MRRLLLFSVIVLLSTIFLPSTIYAQSCEYPESCDAGSGPQSGQHTCNGSIQDGSCHFDPSVDPACTQCQPLSPTPTKPSTDNQTTQTTTPIQLQPSPQTQKFPSTEEQAIYNQCSGTSPDEVCPNSPEDNIFKKLLNIISKLFFFSPQNTNKLNQQTTSVHDDNLPDELSSTEKNNPSKNLKNDLGTPNGYYSINQPDLSDNQNTSKNPIGVYELNYENENFPEGIHPITNNQLSPPPAGQTP